MIELDKAIFAVLDTDRQSATTGSLGALGLTGVHVNGSVPEGATYPYVRFGPMSEQASNLMGAGPLELECVYMVLAVDQGGSKARAAALHNRVKALLHKQPLSTDAPVRHLATLLDRKLDIPDRLEGVIYDQVGANYRMWVEES